MIRTAQHHHCCEDYGNAKITLRIEKCSSVFNVLFRIMQATHNNINFENASLVEET